MASAPNCECRDVPDEAYYDGRVAAEAVRVLDEIRDQPFFVAVGFWKPHARFNAPSATGICTTARRFQILIRRGRRLRRKLPFTMAVNCATRRRVSSPSHRSKRPKCGMAISPT